jgi:hypothetical protein
MGINIRQPATAGTFYPADREKLESILARFLGNVPAFTESRPPKALIVPHAGYIYSGQVAAHAYARIRSHRYKKVILLGPSHHVYLYDVVSDTHKIWQTPLGEVPVVKNDFETSESAHLEEHCLEIQLPFLQHTLKDFEILPLVVGGSDVYSVSGKIKKILDDNTLLIISSDLSHYHNYSEAEKLDKSTIKAIESLNAEGITEACGETPIRVLIDIARTLFWKPEVLKYNNSGDVTGDRTQVVGYASVAFYA